MNTHIQRFHIILWACLAVLMPTVIFAQEQELEFKAPDYDEIKAAIEQKGGEYYYPTLLNRFKKCDTTMSIDQLRALYYGSVFQDNYDPYNSVDMSSIYKALKRKNKTKKNSKDLEKQLNELITENPTHLPLYYCLFINNMDLYDTKSPKVDNVIQQMFLLLDAISSTGDGRSEKTAFYVINTSHEYTLMQAYGFYYTSQSLQTSGNDVFDVIDIKGSEFVNINALYADIGQLYFNITRCFRHLQKKNSNKTKEAEP